MHFNECLDSPPSELELQALLKTTDELTLVLKGHLLIEHVLSLLTEQRIGAGARDAWELGFARKTAFAIERGVVPPDELEMLRAVNRLRNRFAHQPRSYIASEDADQLWRTLSGRIRERVSRVGEEPAGFDTDADFFRCVVLAICTVYTEDFFRHAPPESERSA